MTRLGAAITLALVSAVSAGAQSAPGNPPDTPPQSNLPLKNASASLSLPNGTGIVGALTTNLDTKHSKVGDRVEVEVTQDVKPAGQVLLRRGSHITGQVALAYAFSKGDSTAKLEIVLDKVVAKSGEQIPTYLAIYALAAKNDPTKEDLQDGRGLAATSTRAGINGGLGRPGNGLLGPDTKGVIGLESLRLTPLARDNPPTSLVRSESKDVRLEKGTEIVLVVVGP
jgi:hypothetical protein